MRAALFMEFYYTGPVKGRPVTPNIKLTDKEENLLKKRDFNIVRPFVGRGGRLKDI